MATSTVKNFEELPVALQVMDVKRALGISRGAAYDLVRRKDFPSVKLGERRYIIPRDRFMDWLYKQAEK